MEMVIGTVAPVVYAPTTVSIGAKSLEQTRDVMLAIQIVRFVMERSILIAIPVILFM
jgi:hypothetical protein